MPSKGFSKTKIKDLRDELTFNTVLNLLLPLTLTKTEYNGLKKWLPKVDRLRKLRNSIVHNELRDSEIREKEVIDGLHSAVALFDFIENKTRRIKLVKRNRPS